MTSKDVLIKAIAHATGHLDTYVEAVIEACPVAIAFRREEIPDDEAADLLERLREEAPAIREWLAAGAALADQWSSNPLISQHNSKDCNSLRIRTFAMVTGDVAHGRDFT
jgi:hypothetical protein